MSAKHHPSEAWLLDYAAGNTNSLFETIMRAHIGACEECRSNIMFAEKLGGEILAAETPLAGKLNAHEICDHYEQIEGGTLSVSRADEVVAHGAMEVFVSTYLKRSIDALPWKRIGAGLQLCRLAHENNTNMWMLRGQAGTVLPAHTHVGGELTLVLKGAYFCGSTIFSVGDIEDADESTEHQPVITRDGECICLAVTEGKLRFNGWLPRLAQPFVGI